MSKFIKAITVVASLFAAGSALANDCGHLAFYGQTANHKKEVSVCVFSKGDANFVKYRFGKIGEKPELEFVKPTSTAMWMYTQGFGAWESTFELTNGAYAYTLAKGADPVDGEYASITVSKADKMLADIKLDSKSTIQNGIVDVPGSDEYHRLTEFGFKGSYADDEVSETTALAPRLTN